LEEGRGVRKSSILKWGGLVLPVVVIGGALYGWTQLEPYGRIGATYIAKQYCSCVFVAGRSEGSCRAEFKPDIDRFNVSVDRSGLPASASVQTHLLMFSSAATYAEGFGCTVAK
jgi:hypothetical protein